MMPDGVDFFVLSVFSQVQLVCRWHWQGEAQPGQEGPGGAV